MSPSVHLDWSLYGGPAASQDLLKSLLLKYERGDEENDVMNILVATDLHVGYKEKDSERGKDSFIALEEIFTIGKERNVDFILLGGDLFHENKPSRKTLHRTMELFRKYCLGYRPSQIKIVSDQAVNFGHTSSSISCVNYEDPNINIRMPVFSIHGNHDDPTGVGELSAIDFLSVSGFLNHFGKSTSLEKIEVSPILMQKGTTNLALYGLGSIRDERLHRLFQNNRVEFCKTPDQSKDWFNVFVLHQNRSKHGPTNHIPEEFIDPFFDLVIWGHEHECRIKPEWNCQQNFHVMQPGSSVATSLCEAESKNKKVAILKIKGRKMKTDVIPLRTVRQMYVDTIVLSECLHLKNSSPKEMEREATDYCNEKVESLLMRAEEERTMHEKQPKKPLIRLRVDHSDGFDTFNAYRFGAQFAERVANPENIVLFLKRSSKRKVDGFDVKDMDAMINKEDVGKKMEDLVQTYLTTKDKKDQMALLTASGVSHAVSVYVEKQEKDAIVDLCEHQIKKTTNHLKQQDILADRDEIVEEVAKFHALREQKACENSVELNRSDGVGDISNDPEELMGHRVARGEKARRFSSDDEISALDRDEMDVSNQPPPKTKAKRGRAAVKPRGRGSAKSAASRSGGRVAKASPVTVNTLDSFLTDDSYSNLETQPANSGASRSKKNANSLRLDKQIKEEATIDLTQDEDDLGWPKPKPPPSSNRKKRGKGVLFDSSDEEEANQSRPFKRNKR